MISRCGYALGRSGLPRQRDKEIQRDMSNTKNGKFKEQASEARGESEAMRVKYNGHSYRILAQSEWSIDLLEAFYDAESNPMSIVKAFREMLGEAQYKAFKSRHNKMSDMLGFFEAWRAEMERTSAPN